MRRIFSAGGEKKKKWEMRVRVQMTQRVRRKNKTRALETHWHSWFLAHFFRATKCNLANEEIGIIFGAFTALTVKSPLLLQRAKYPFLGLAMNRKNELSDKKHAATDGEEKEKGNLQGESHVCYSSSFFLSWVMMQDSSSFFFLHLFLFLLPFLLVLAEAAT